MAGPPGRAPTKSSQSPPCHPLTSTWGQRASICLFVGSASSRLAPQRASCSGLPSMPFGM
eukprot:2438666-Lingulodinium_polyedra.AAC.1